MNSLTQRATSESLLEPMSFEDITLIQIPVQIAGQDYLLCEADGRAACRYRNAMLDTADISTGTDKKIKVNRIRNIADTEPLLVSLCLFKVVKIDNASPGLPAYNLEPVSLETVQRWPSRVIKSLYDRAKKISELGEGEEEKTDEPNPPKEPNAITDGFGSLPPKVSLSENANETTLIEST